MPKGIAFTTQAGVQCVIGTADGGDTGFLKFRDGQAPVLIDVLHLTRSEAHELLFAAKALIREMERGT